LGVSEQALPLVVDIDTMRVHSKSDVLPQGFCVHHWRDPKHRRVLYLLQARVDEESFEELEHTRVSPVEVWFGKHVPYLFLAMRDLETARVIESIVSSVLIIEEVELPGPVIALREREADMHVRKREAPLQRFCGVIQLEECGVLCGVKFEL
jgi:hypothetical protein